MVFFTRLFGLVLLFCILVLKSYEWPEKKYFYIEIIGLALWTWSEMHWLRRRKRHDSSSLSEKNREI